MSMKSPISPNNESRSGGTWPQSHTKPPQGPHLRPPWAPEGRASTGGSSRAVPAPCCAEKLLWAPGKEPDSSETELPGLITAQEEAAPRAHVHVSLASRCLLPSLWERLPTSRGAAITWGGAEDTGHRPRGDTGRWGEEPVLAHPPTLDFTMGLLGRKTLGLSPSGTGCSSEN